MNVELQNNTGSILPPLIPVSIDADGGMKAVVVSNETDSLNTVGVLTEQVLNTNYGMVVRSGRINNVNSLGFNFRDILYVSKIGDLTNVVPATGIGGFVAGDFARMLGIAWTGHKTSVLMNFDEF